MEMKEKEQLIDEIHLKQPHMLASFLVQKRLGITIEKMDFLLNILLICFQAMKTSGLEWPIISEDLQERQLTNFVGAVKFGDDLAAGLRNQVINQYIESHPEKDLLAYVNGEIVQWLSHVVACETDKYIMMAAISFVNCIAYVPMNESN
ncbi:MAG: hypothetical protein HQM09_25300 [Candidatus Riflebacteria bacterium]|nr:hypothetical protein [Candidatus Riflebacteria bacterium]